MRKLVQKVYFFDLNRMGEQGDLDLLFNDWNSGSEFGEIVIAKQYSEKDKLFRYISEGRLGTVYIRLTIINSQRLKVDIYEELFGTFLPFSLFMCSFIMLYLAKLKSALLLFGAASIFLGLTFYQFKVYAKKLKLIIEERISSPR